MITLIKLHRRRKRGAGPGGGGAGPPIMWERGQHTFCPPPPPPPNYPLSFSINFNVKQEKIKLKGKIIINATLIWFEGIYLQTIPFNSILEFSILSNFKTRNVIIWHWLLQNLVGTWRRNDVDATSLRCIDVSTTSCACWEFGPSWPPIF